MRRICALSLVGFLVVGMLINEVFLKKMEFVQSKVYPNLFLIKHPVENKDSLHLAIKNKVLHEIKDPFNSTTEAFKFKQSNTDEIANKIAYTLRFYEYTTAWGFNNGTVHFLEHQEDPGGFSSEELTNYYEYKMAYFNVTHCKNDSLQYIGKLSFFKDGNEVKTEAIIDLCDKNN